MSVIQSVNMSINSQYHLEALIHPILPRPGLCFHSHTFTAISDEKLLLKLVKILRCIDYAPLPQDMYPDPNRESPGTSLQCLLHQN